MKSYSMFLLLGAVLFLFSCEKETPDPTPDPTPDATVHTLATIVNGADVQSYNYYLQPLENLQKGEKTSYDNTAAVEAFAAGSAGVFEFEGAIYINSYNPSPIIEKWTLQDDNSYSKEGSMPIPELGFQGNPCFKDAQTAFVAGPAQSKILIFNPNTMKKTGFIDFSKFSKVGTSLDFPNKGDLITIEACTEMVISGKYMYVAINHLFDFFKYIPGTSDTYILVIDLTKVDANSLDNSDAVIDLIKSDKGCFAGGWNSGFGAQFMAKDEKGDVYMLSHNMWGFAGALTQKSACVLRIKSGETVFDDSYYLNVEEVTNGIGNPVLNLEYGENGKVFVAALDVTKVDPNNPTSLYTDPISQWYMVDLYAKNATKVSDNYTIGTLNGNTYFEDGNAYLPYSNKTESYMLKYNIDSKQGEKLFTTQGTPMLFKK